MNDKIRNDFIDYIAKNPLEGTIIQGTDGARKIRWQSDSHTGKSGGAPYTIFMMRIYLFFFLLLIKKINVKTLHLLKKRL